MNALAEEVGRLVFASTDGAVGLVAFHDDRRPLDLGWGWRPIREITATVKSTSSHEDKTVRWTCDPDWGAQPIAGWILWQTRGGWAR